MRATLLIGVLVFGAIGVAAADLESGVAKWLRLRGDLAAARGRIALLYRETADLEREIGALEGEGFALERAIREDLGFAKSGEIVVRFEDRRKIGREPVRFGRSGSHLPDGSE